MPAQGPRILDWTLEPPTLDGGVDPSGSVVLQLEPRLTDFRVRLVDGNGRLVPARESIDLGAHTRVTVHADKPLQPATHYLMVIEPDASDAILDAGGQTYRPTSIAFLTSGEPVRKLAHRRRRRRR